MLPELFSIGPFTVYSYGLMTALGILSAVWLGEHESKRSGLGEDGYILGLGMRRRSCFFGLRFCRRLRQTPL